MEFTSPNLTRAEKLELLQRWIIVQSILYYEMNVNLVTDAVFDANCRQLVRGMEKSHKSLKKTSYYYCMHDFDGATGFDLYHKLNEHDRAYLTQIAGHLASQTPFQPAHRAFKSPARNKLLQDGVIRIGGK